MPQTIAPTNINTLLNGSFTVTVAMPPRYKDGPVTWLEVTGTPLDNDIRGVLIKKADGTLHFYPWSNVAEVRYP